MAKNTTKKILAATAIAGVTVAFINRKKIKEKALTFGYTYLAEKAEQFICSRYSFKRKPEVELNEKTFKAEVINPRIRRFTFYGGNYLLDESIFYGTKPTEDFAEFHVDYDLITDEMQDDLFLPISCWEVESYLNTEILLQTDYDDWTDAEALSVNTAISAKLSDFWLGSDIDPGLGAEEVISLVGVRHAYTRTLCGIIRISNANPSIINRVHEALIGLSLNFRFRVELTNGGGKEVYWLEYEHNNFSTIAKAASDKNIISSTEFDELANLYPCDVRFDTPHI